MKLSPEEATLTGGEWHGANGRHIQRQGSRKDHVLHTNTATSRAESATSARLGERFTV